VVNLGLYLHYRAFQDGGGVRIPPSIWALTLFILVFTLAIALFKDIPDTEGDRRYNIATFTLRLGRKAVFDGCRGLITLGYLGLMLAGLLGLPAVNAPVLVVSHGLTLALLWWGTARVDLQDQAAIAQAYQFIWKLYFLEYILFPLACLLH
jgi:homogentisate phytyltransferase / homogentisate geranylgeranyltransferase